MAKVELRGETIRAPAVRLVLDFVVYALFCILLLTHIQAYIGEEEG
ncbi:MAG TPA: hypothetical protein VHG28_08515 [Longimicrobiaceae bacterium]|nr:hypothetical protein [Longimicrobiaceae bacterium]